MNFPLSATNRRGPAIKMMSWSGSEVVNYLTNEMSAQPMILVMLLNTSFTMLLYRVCLERFFSQASNQLASGSRVTEEPGSVLLFEVGFIRFARDFWGCRNGATKWSWIAVDQEASLFNETASVETIMKDESPVFNAWKHEQYFVKRNFYILCVFSSFPRMKSLYMLLVDCWEVVTLAGCLSLRSDWCWVLEHGCWYDMCVQDMRSSLLNPLTLFISQIDARINEAFIFL